MVDTSGTSHVLFPNVGLNVAVVVLTDANVEVFNRGDVDDDSVVLSVDPEIGGKEGSFELK